MTKLQSLAPGVKRSLIEHCARELNFIRYGTNTPFYLWEASNRREVECVLRAAEQFLNGSRDSGEAPDSRGRA